MNENQKVFFSFRTEPVLIVWSKIELTNLMIKIDGKPYIGQSDSDKKTFRFVLPKPDKACDCLADVYVSNNLVKEGLFFRLEREGMQKSAGFNSKMGGFGKK